MRPTVRIYKTFQAALSEAMEQRGAYVCKIKPDDTLNYYTLTLEEKAATV